MPYQWNVEEVWILCILRIHAGLNPKALSNLTGIRQRVIESKLMTVSRQMPPSEAAKRTGVMIPPDPIWVYVSGTTIRHKMVQNVLRAHQILNPPGWLNQQQDDDLVVLVLWTLSLPLDVIAQKLAHRFPLMIHDDGSTGPWSANVVAQRFTFLSDAVASPEGSFSWWNDEESYDPAAKARILRGHGVPAHQIRVGRRDV